MRQFIDACGSHYVERVYYGQKLTIRASIASKSTSTVSSFRAAIKAVAIFWSASGSIDTAHENLLRSSTVDISATILGGGVEPPGAAYISSWDDVKNLLGRLRCGDVVIRSGPVAVDLKSYWHTLDAYPRTRAVLGGYEQPAPAEAPWGVPRGAVVGWRPLEENLVRNADTGEVIEVVAPRGWALCTQAGGGPNFDGMFLRGVSTMDELDAVRGSPTHSHQVTGRTTYETEGTLHGPEGADNHTGKPNWNHKHDFAVESAVAEHLPPYVGLMFIYKL